MAIVAIALSVLALAGVVLLGAAVFLMPSSSSGSSQATSGDYTLLGTLPDARPGQPVPPDALVKEVKRVLDNDGSTYSGITCGDLPSLKAGATVTCRGTVDDAATRMEIKFQDDIGHFIMNQFW